MIRKLFFLIPVLVLATACEVYFMDDVFAFDENPFAAEETIRSDDDGLFKALIFTDAHIDKKGGSVRDWSQTIISLAAEKDFDLVISLGDLSDTGSIHSDEIGTFIRKVTETETPFLALVGNHELHSGYDAPDWKAFYHDMGAYGPVGCWRAGPVAIYALDNSKRIFSARQLEWFEQAVSSTDAKYRIVLMHEDFTSGDHFDQGMGFMYGSADAGEWLYLMQIAAENNVRLMLNGHRHNGGGLSQHKGFQEFNLDALCEGSSIFSSEGKYYTLTLDEQTGTAVLRSWHAADRSLEESWTMQF